MFHTSVGRVVILVFYRIGINGIVLIENDPAYSSVNSDWKVFYKGLSDVLVLIQHVVSSCVDPARSIVSCILEQSSQRHTYVANSAGSRF
jgi:hypothetical protein